MPQPQDVIWPAGIELLHLGRDVSTDFIAASRSEWLVTNGIGGFACGTVSGAVTRRYHGLLVAALRPPLERVVTLVKLDITARYGQLSVPLTTNEYADGTVHPHGYRHLDSFELQGLLPVWRWVIGDALLEQCIWMAHGENTTYHILQQPPLAAASSLVIRGSAIGDATP